MAKEDRKDKSLQEIADIVGIGCFDTHLFICTGPDCCTPEEGMAAWRAVKRTVKDLNPDLRQAKLYRTKVGCLRICKGGPIAVAYPQGKWFHSVTEETAPGIVEYLQSGAQGPHPLEFAAHPLTGQPLRDEDAAD
ncbi:MAG TPA: (2Fe-2S) ferredoxin domain-containing protein [bacterium]|nr:(2Fe-2S) ferredoxin domain-containing protein [bacterium]